MNSTPFVSIILPCRNERNTIAQCLDSILASDYPSERFELLVVDGMSDDGTREVLRNHAPRGVRLIDNPRRIVPVALNLGIAAARGEIIIRMDAHTRYAADYVRQCVEVLQETGATNVGGAARTEAHGFLQQAISLAYHSPFSAGGARFHNIEYEGPIDTVPYGCWRKATLVELGMFDEELVRNQDDELNLRITRGGGQVWQSARIKSWYQTRASLRALFRQYAQYGYWKVRVIQKRRLPASVRHLVPGLFVGSLLALAALSLFSRAALWLFLLEAGLYVTANLAASLVTCRGRWKFLPVMPVVFAAYHFGYGWGFLRGLIDFVVFRRSANTRFTAVTRPS